MGLAPGNPPLQNCEPLESKLRKQVQGCWRGLLKECKEKDLDKQGTISASEFLGALRLCPLCHSCAGGCSPWHKPILGGEAKESRRATGASGEWAACTLCDWQLETRPVSVENVALTDQAARQGRGSGTVRGGPTPPASPPWCWLNCWDLHTTRCGVLAAVFYTQEVGARGVVPQIVDVIGMKMQSVQMPPQQPPPAACTSPSPDSHSTLSTHCHHSSGDSTAGYPGPGEGERGDRHRRPAVVSAALVEKFNLDMSKEESQQLVLKYDLKNNGRFAYCDFIQSCVLLLKAKETALMHRMRIQNTQKMVGVGSRGGAGWGPHSATSQDSLPDVPGLSATCPQTLLRGSWTRDTC
ncbi:Hypothetical predicted protein [Marmota monax]|uniref:EF-hand domain-containing protein n=1 Tax=Marmota monax TaxID=9995 RepID=A0A5E4CIZ0_MARMO|nr:Hypothetical predicted protein [Marmota monax]